MGRYYVLVDRTATEATPEEWARYFETANRQVKVTKSKGVTVSTVFLGLDHNWGDGPPHIFETMVFGGPLDQEEVRYSTWDEAVAGHAAMVERAGIGA